MANRPHWPLGAGLKKAVWLPCIWVAGCPGGQTWFVRARCHFALLYREILPFGSVTLNSPPAIEALRIAG
jgi:hypothetical protein